MDVYEKNFIRAQGEAYEGTGKVPSSYDVADALNGAGFTTSRGGEYKGGGRGIPHLLSRVASTLHEEGDDEGCEMVRRILSPDGNY
mgnify:CR=1 FL=1